jgi:uncharacterized membrane protein/predicted DsbA family dithiol-disulfide isomerase
MTPGTKPAELITMMPRHLVIRRAIILLGAAGLATSLVMLYVHHQLAVSSGSYTSFCNMSDQVNCDAVLGSRYAYFLGIPVAVWTTATYLAFIVLAVMPGSLPGFALAALAGVSVGYSIVLAFVSVALLDTVCLMCAGLYVVNVALLALVWAHLAPVARRPAAAAAVLGPLAVAIVVGYGSARSAPAAVELTEAEIAAQQPDFYRWYISQPVLAGTADVPFGPIHSRGPADAPVTIVEFSDFACTHCASAHRALKTVIDRHPDEVRLIFRHFPLDRSCNPALLQQLHPSACDSAIAAECAGEQDRFWEYHDYLFEHQEPLDYLAVAADLGLQVERFRECLKRGGARATVARDIRRGTQLGVKSTPTTYINGRAIMGALAEPLYEHAVAIEMGRARTWTTMFRQSR